MRIRTLRLTCAILPLLAGCTGTNGSPHTGQPTLQGQAMQQRLADVGQIRGFVYGGGSQGDAENAAADLVARSQHMADLFPPGQASTDYVDMSPERAHGAPAAMSKSADLLMAAVRTGNRAAIGQQLVQTERNGCGFCHLSGSH